MRLILTLCLSLWAGAAPAQSVETILKVAQFALDLRERTSAAEIAEATAAELDAQLSQLIEAQISEPRLSDLLDARLDAFALRQTQRALAGAALRLEACSAAACPGELAALEAQLARMGAEIATLPLSAATVALLERARALHLAVAAAKGAPEAERAALSARYGRFFAALAAETGPATARAALLEELATLTGVSAAELAAGPQLSDADAAIDLYLARHGGALIGAALTEVFGPALRPLDRQAAPGQVTFYFNCRLNRTRMGLFDGRVAPFVHYEPLERVVGEEDAFLATGAPQPGMLHSLLWLGVSLIRTPEGGVTAEARQYALFDGQGALALPYAGEFYRNTAAWAEAAIPLRGARTAAQLLERLGVYPWTGEGTCPRTDGLVLTQPEAGFSTLEQAVEPRAEAALAALRGLAGIERVRQLAEALAGS